MNKSVIITKVTSGNLFSNYFKFLDKEQVKIFVYNEMDADSFDSFKIPKFNSVFHAYCFHIAQNYNVLTDLNYFLSSEFFDKVLKSELFLEAINKTDFVSRKSTFNFDKQINTIKVTPTSVDAIKYINDIFELSIDENTTEMRYNFSDSNFQISKQVIQTKPIQFYQKVLDMYSYNEHIPKLDLGLLLFFKSL
jgi:hypothetical protein